MGIPLLQITAPTLLGRLQFLKLLKQIGEKAHFFGSLGLPNCKMNMQTRLVIGPQLTLGDVCVHQCLLYPLLYNNGYLCTQAIPTNWHHW